MKLVLAMKLSDDLITLAEELISSGSRKGPRQSSHRRAMSTTYYAMFHCLARCCADTLIGTRASRRSERAWSQTYRALEHGATKTACQRNIVSRFPEDIKDFANVFVTLQGKRHKADYGPFENLTKLDVIGNISAARDAIQRLEWSPIKDRRAFAAYVLFKYRK